MVYGDDYEIDDEFLKSFQNSLLLKGKQEEIDPKKLGIEPAPLLPRPGIGKNGRLIDLLINWYSLQTPKKVSVYMYNVTITEETKPKPAGGRGRGRGRGGGQSSAPTSKEMTNKENIQLAFWEVIRTWGREFTQSVCNENPSIKDFVFDGRLLYLPYKIIGRYCRGVEHPDEKLSKTISVKVVINYAGGFYLNPISDQPDVATFSQMFAKALAVQPVILPPQNSEESEFTSKWFYTGGNVFEIPKYITYQSKRDLEMKVLPGIRAWLGFTTALKVGDQNQLFLNIGLVNSLFYRMDMDLIDFYIEIEMDLGAQPETIQEVKKYLSKMAMDHFQRERMEKYTKDLRVTSKEALCYEEKKYKGKTDAYLTERHFKITGIGNKSAHSFLTEARNDKGEQLTMEAFYHIKGKKLRYPNLPVVLVKCGKKESCQPMEILVIHDSPQRYTKVLDYIDARRFIQKVTRSPSEYKRQTDRMIKLMDFSARNSYFTRFGMDLHLEMTKCQGRVLGPPMLRDAEGQEHELQEDRSYRIKEVSEPAEDIIMDFCTTIDPRNYQRAIDLSDAREFYNLLVDKMKDRGMIINRQRQPQVYTAQLVPDLNDPKLYEVDVDEVEFKPKYKPKEGIPTFPAVARDAKQKFRQIPDYKNKTHIIIIATVKGDDFYGRIKYLLDSYICIPCQVVLRETIKKALLEASVNSYKIPFSIALKINGKLGGANMNVDLPPYLHGGDDDLKVSSVMYVGIDVTHPGILPGRDCWDDPMGISIACIVGSIDLGATRYRKRTLAQMKVRETIERFDTQFAHLMMDYYQRNKQYPKHIVIYRDGVSDSEMQRTCAIELKWIKDSWDAIVKDSSTPEEHRVSPTFTYIVVQKRHRTRFIRPLGDEKYANPPSGTVVDQLAVSPKQFDFWMNAHDGAIGTSRPIHYTVVFDEWRLSPDQIYEMTYRLCFLNARCRKPCALPVPVFYAHRACAQDKEKYREFNKYNPHASQAEIEHALNVKSAYPGMPFV